MAGYIIYHKKRVIEQYPTVKRAKVICQMALRLSADLLIFYQTKKPVELLEKGYKLEVVN